MRGKRVVVGLTGVLAVAVGLTVSSVEAPATGNPVAAGQWVNT